MSRARKILLLLLASALLAGGGFVQKSLNHDRDRLGLTRAQPLENAPPVLAFTTVALGGFRGLISNALWIRANDLQDEDKFFEAMQLAGWITKLEPHFTQVWLVQAWNMAYNISVKFKDFSDRWRWVKAGIELLRDDGLRYNPNEPLMYRELGWFFQHKMGANLDDAHLYYKKKWRDEMQQMFRSPHPNWDELIDPKTDEAKQRAKLLRDKYKMDAEFMKECDEKYGPLEWRLPQAHAVYWAAYGLKIAKENPKKVNQDELIQLRRVIYQSMQASVRHGRLIDNPLAPAGLELGPNIEIVRKTNGAYEQAMIEDEKNRNAVVTGHRNFLRDAVYFLYTSNREGEAAEWYAYLGKKYPKNTLLEGQTNSAPTKLGLFDYVVGRVEEEVHDTSNENTRALIEGLVIKSLVSLALDQDDLAIGFKQFAQRVRERYKSKTVGIEDRLPMPTVDEIKDELLQRMLDPKLGLPDEMKLMLRQKLGLPPSTNSPPASVSK